MNRKIVYLITAVILLSIVFELFASENGVAGVTGSPGETTCNTTGCHTQYTLNSGAGSISISSNIPATGYVPSANYSVTVTVRFSGFSLFGFGFEALSSSNSNAGTLSITNTATTQLVTATNGRINVIHTFSGGQNNDSMAFTFAWQAPSTNIGTVTFYAAGDAANSNGSVSGDYIYSTTKTIIGTPRITTGIIASTPFCAGDSGITIPFTKIGNFNSGNIFTAQLSDASGSFSSPVNIGTLNSTNGGNIISSLPLPATAGTKYRIRVVSDNPVITGSINTVDLTIGLPPSAANAGADQTICSATASLAANAPTTGTGTWKIIAGSGTIASASNPTTTVSALDSGANILVWTISNGGCKVNTDTIIINSKANPTIANAGPDKTACSNSTSFDGNTVASGTGTWTLLSGTGNITDPSDPNSTITNLGTGKNIFLWSIANLPCASTYDTVEITNGSIFPANAGSDQTLCIDSALLAGNPPPDGTGSWSLVSGAGVINDSLAAVTAVSNLGTGQNIFRWTVTKSPCSPSIDDVIISVSGKPSAANAGADQPVCSDFATLAAAFPASGTGSWNALTGSGAITDILNPVSAVNNLSIGANTFVWTVANPPCDPTSDTVEINRTASITVANAGPDQTICLSSIILAGNAAVTGNGNWSLISGSGNITDPANPASAVTSPGAGTNIFRWTISGGHCTPTIDEVTINNCSNHFITTGNISGSPFCDVTSYSVVVPFTATGNFTENFIAELSDNTGNFTIPVSIGSGAGSPISGTIPAFTAPGDEYRIRVTNAVLKGTAGSDSLSINTCNTGINKLSAGNHFKAFPNPNNGSFDIQFVNDVQGSCVLSIFNVMSVCIQKTEFRGISPGELQHFELAPRIKGIVYLILQTENDVWSSRMIVE